MFKLLRGIIHIFKGATKAINVANAFRIRAKLYYTKIRNLKTYTHINPQVKYLIESHLNNE